MKKWDGDGNCCTSCAWRDADSSCKAKQDLNSTHPCNGTAGLGCFYANKEQIEAMLQWCEEKAKTKAVPEFQIGDEVTVIEKLHGIITQIDNKSGSYPIIANLEGKGHFSFNLKGEANKGRGRMLYHGHDLEVIIKEKLPVRPKKTREAWVVLTSTYGPGHISHFEFKTELAAIDYCTKHFGIILSNPIKVEVPE